MFVASRLLAGALILPAVALAGPSRADGQQAASDTLRIGLVVPAAARTTSVESAARGERLGVEEAAHAASLFARAVLLVEGTDADRLMTDARVSALMGGFSEGECRTLGDVAARRDVIFVNLGCDMDALRGEACRRTTFHVAPSAEMLADAVRQARMEDGPAASIPPPKRAWYRSFSWPAP
ncbi:MAG TPA: hypothetical protein VM759_10080 [Longimicrobium sp.]|nr:hypothetical protein [Longimicrobium sp.]